MSDLFFHRRYIVLFALLFAVINFVPAFALNVPSLRARVNDLAGMLSPEAAQALEQRLADFERETGHQIAVLTIPGLEGDAIEDFSIRVAEAWKIGKKGFDNGAILLIAQKERKLRIEVGYGLEGVLPDVIATRIIQEDIVPRFRQNNYAAGIQSGIDALLQVTRGEGLPHFPASITPVSNKNKLWGFLALLLILSLPRTIMWRLIVPNSRAQGALIGGGLGFVLGSLASFVADTHLGVSGTIVLIMLGMINGIVWGLESYLRASRTFANHIVRWNEPFYLGGDGFSMATRPQGPVAVGVNATSTSGASAGGFSGGGGGFGGGGASGGW